MRYGISWAVAAAVAVAAPAVAADPDTAATFDALRQVDGRMAAIAYRLTTANAPLCRSLAPTPGWAIHSLGQYDPALRDQARANFGFETPIAVEAVVPGSAAAKAGFEPAIRSCRSTVGRSVVALRARTRAVPRVMRRWSRSRGSQLIGLAVELMREGRTRTVTIPASPGCRSAFEVLLGPGMTATADGRIVQIGVRFFERYTDDEVAVVVAHELSHNILRHAARLEAAGVKRGLLSEVGRNGRLFG
ncbi:peptidase M48 family protein [Sphingomonas sp. WKB10]|nr:peptidase M48 family protein [Sphingomonas sp. WKB10]